MKLFDFNKIMEAFTGFIETKVELWKLEAKEEIGALIAKMLLVMLVALFATMMLLFFTLGLAYWLNVVLESRFIGFIVVGMIYAGLTGIIYFNRRSIIDKMIEKQNQEIDGVSTIDEEI